MCDQFAINRILRGLRVARNLERDCVFRVRTQVVADQLDGVRRENSVSEFPAASLHRGCEQPGMVMLLRIPPSWKSSDDSLLLKTWVVGKPGVETSKVHFPRENGVSWVFLICDIAVRPMPEFWSRCARASAARNLNHTTLAMTEIHLKRLVNEAVLLHRDIAIRTDRLKTLKADLVREAASPRT